MAHELEVLQVFSVAFSLTYLVIFVYNLFTRNNSVHRVYKFDERAKLPTRNNNTDAGLDLYALEDVFIPYGTTKKIRTGIAFEVKEGYVGKIEDRSSLGAAGLKVGGGVIDALYAGELSVILNNVTNRSAIIMDHPDRMQHGYQIKAGDRIAQILIYKVDTEPCQWSEQLWTSPRGNKGLGSSGK